jgi:hypothetical protein
MSRYDVKRHLAGPYKDLVQVCTRCDEVLTDNRNAAWPVRQDEPRGWKEGTEVVVERIPGRIGYWAATIFEDPAPPCTPEGLQ